MQIIAPHEPEEQRPTYERLEWLRFTRPDSEATLQKWLDWERSEGVTQDEASDMDAGAVLTLAHAVKYAKPSMLTCKLFCFADTGCFDVIENTDFGTVEHSFTLVYTPLASVYNYAISEYSTKVESKFTTKDLKQMLNYGHSNDCGRTCGQPRKGQ